MRSIQKQILLINILLSLLLLTACGSAGSSQARTYYESLDLATPERAVITFINAFNRNDFPTVWLVLAPKAQFYYVQYINMLQYGNLVQLDIFMDYKNEIPVFSEGLGTGEQSEADTGYVFDEFMMLAVRHDAFLIDLRGALNISESVSSLTSKGDHCVDVLASVGKLESVTFRMVQAPSGRWRVLQVIVPDGDEEQIPWSVPAE